MDEHVAAEREYHLKRWQYHYDLINSYYEKMSTRLTLAFGIITVFSAYTYFIYNDKSQISSIIENGSLLSASILLSLLFIHEMKIFLRLIMNYYPMLYHAYVLQKEYNQKDFIAILKNSDIDSSQLTMIFMFLSNIIVILVCSFSIYTYATNIKSAYDIAALVLCSLSLIGYVFSAILTCIYTIRIHGTYDDDVLTFLKQNTKSTYFIYPKRIKEMLKLVLNTKGENNNDIEKRKGKALSSKDQAHGG